MSHRARHARREAPESSPGPEDLIGSSYSAPASVLPATCAAALPFVRMARPTGVGRAITAYVLPIEGRDEWLAAARRLA